MNLTAFLTHFLCVMLGGTVGVLAMCMCRAAGEDYTEVDGCGPSSGTGSESA